MPYFTPNHPLSQDVPPRLAGMLSTPIVFERADPPRWEYHVVTIDLREEPPLDEERLTTLGTEGWLLAGVLPIPGRDTLGRVAYYFIRST